MACRKPISARSILLVVCLSSCLGSPGHSSAEAPSPSTPTPAASCPIEKLGFTQKTGCRNDGSVEFCLPTGNEPLLAHVQAIAPSIQAGSSRGRARCNVPAERLYFFPTGEAECVARHGALVDAAWEQLCRIAELPEVRAIVPTWFK
jgi:hypothetical protein